MEETGVIFDVKHFAVNDGPGIRTTVFVKGCPLRCLWCHNPESLSGVLQLLYTESKCIGCGYCIKACSKGAQVMIDGKHALIWELCDSCGECVAECYSGALEFAGKRVKVLDMMKEVNKDRVFYKNSGGGLTISGGEPLIQHGFSKALLRQAQRSGVHTALDTSGYAPWETLKGVLDHTDLVLYDLKHMDSDTHLRLTGVPNELIKENLEKIDALGKPVWIRIPLIPGMNDDERHFRQIGEYLAKFKQIERIDILRYHRLAESKYEHTGMSYKLMGLETPKKENVEDLADILRSLNIKITVS